MKKSKKIKPKEERNKVGVFCKLAPVIIKSNPNELANSWLQELYSYTAGYKGD